MTEAVRTFFDRWMASVDVRVLFADYLKAEETYYRSKGYDLHHEPGIGWVWERDPFLYRFDLTPPPSSLKLLLP